MQTRKKKKKHLKMERKGKKIYPQERKKMGAIEKEKLEERQEKKK